MRKNTIYILLPAVAFILCSSPAAKAQTKEFLKIQRILKERLTPIRDMEPESTRDKIYQELEHCSKLFEKKEYQQALESVDEFIKQYKGHPLYSDALYLRAEILFTQNSDIDSENVDAAYDTIDALTDAINSNPKAIPAEDALFEIARLYTILNLPSDAIKYYQNILEKYPNSHRKRTVLFELGDLYYKNKYYKKCIDIFYPFAEKEDGTNIGVKAVFYLGTCYYHLKNYELASRYFLRGARYDFTVILRKPKVRLRMGDSLFQAKNFKKAEQVLSNLILDYPNFEGVDIALLRLGDTFNEVKRYKEAMKNYIRILSEHPLSKATLTAKMRLADLNAKSANIKLDEDYKEVIYYQKPDRTYKEIIEQYQDSEAEEASLNGLALFYLRNKKYKDAVTAFISLRTKYPKGILARNSPPLFDEAFTKYIKELYTSGKYAEAVNAFANDKKYISKELKFYELYFYVGMSNYNIYLYKEAEKKLIKFMKRPSIKEYRENSKKTLVNIYLKTGREKKAIRTLHSIISEKNSPGITMWGEDTLANYYYEKKRFKQAIRFFASVLKRRKFFKKSDMKNIFRYAVSLQKQRQFRKAKTVLEKTVKAEKQKGEFAESPWFRAILAKYGSMLYRDKAYKSSISIFQKAIEIAQNKTELQSNLFQKALSYHGLNDYKNAKKTFEEITKAGNESFWEKQALFKLKNKNLAK